MEERALENESISMILTPEMTRYSEVTAIEKYGKKILKRTGMTI